MAELNSKRLSMATQVVPFGDHVPASIAASKKALPASFRTTTDDIVRPSMDDPDFLKHELLVPRMDAVRDWLWICGRPMPPRPLHHQIVMQRELVVTENPELHLVWARRRIFLKPIPDWLLDKDFWNKHILGVTTERQQLTACARGFLFSYCALVSYKSDFRIASESGLLPEDVTWESWKQLSANIMNAHSYAGVNPRYWYGELRLSRLNKIYTFSRGNFIRRYSTVDSYAVYVDLLNDNFGTLAAVFAYIIIVLTAMQVGLGVDRLKEDGTFQNASYGFTIFSIIVPLVGVVIIVIVFLSLLCYNLVKTTGYETTRFKRMGVEPDWKKTGA